MDADIIQQIISNSNTDNADESGVIDSIKINLNNTSATNNVSTVALPTSIIHGGDVNHGNDIHNSDDIFGDSDIDAHQKQIEKQIVNLRRNKNKTITNNMDNNINKSEVNKEEISKLTFESVCCVLNTWRNRIIVMSHDLLVAGFRWCISASLFLCLGLVWFGIIPLAVGVLFELVFVIPLRVPIGETPALALCQDWALGLVFLKIWVRLVSLGLFGENYRWKQHFEVIQADGFQGLRVSWVITTVALPLAKETAWCLCAPYVFARGIFPFIGIMLGPIYPDMFGIFLHPYVLSAVYRYVFVIYIFLFHFAFDGFGTTIIYLRRLHDEIRDDKYMVGRKLHNNVNVSVSRNGDDNVGNDEMNDIIN